MSLHSAIGIILSAFLANQAVADDCVAKRLDSSWLNEVVFCQALRRTYLIVRMQDGREYKYHEVNGRVFKELGDAESPGRYFNSRIKDRYRFERIR